MTKSSPDGVSPGPAPSNPINGAVDCNEPVRWKRSRVRSFRMGSISVRIPTWPEDSFNWSSGVERVDPRDLLMRSAAVYSLFWIRELDSAGKAGGPGCQAGMCCVETTKSTAGMDRLPDVISTCCPGPKTISVCRRAGALMVSGPGYVSWDKKMSHLDCVLMKTPRELKPYILPVIPG